jgi:hypothetical protein
MSAVGWPSATNEIVTSGCPFWLLPANAAALASEKVRGSKLDWPRLRQLGKRPVQAATPPPGKHRWRSRMLALIRREPHGSDGNALFAK